MHEHVSVLVKLQDLDSTIGEIEQAKIDYPQKIELLRETLKKEEDLADQKREKLRMLEQERNAKEGHLAHEMERIKNSEEKLLSVKTNKEYKAALKEIASAKESNSLEEESILVILEEVDALKKELKEKEKSLTTMSEEFEKEEKALTVKLNELEEELRDRTRRREKLFAEIDPAILKTYENIRKHRQGIAVVQAKEGFCQGCYMGIPPQLYNEVQRGDDMIFCPNCNRLLYFITNKA